MLAIAARSEREFRVDYACRCRVMYVCGGPPILYEHVIHFPFSRWAKRSPSPPVDTASIMKHPRIRHFDVFSSLFPHSHLAIVARHARFVPVRSLRVSLCRLAPVRLYTYADFPCSHPPTSPYESPLLSLPLSDHEALGAYAPRPPRFQEPPRSSFPHSLRILRYEPDASHRRHHLPLRPSLKVHRAGARTTPPRAARHVPRAKRRDPAERRGTAQHRELEGHALPLPHGDPALARARNAGRCRGAAPRARSHLRLPRVEHRSCVERRGAPCHAAACGPRVVSGRCA